MKRLILTLFLFAGFSFSVFAEFVTISYDAPRYDCRMGNLGFARNETYDYSIFSTKVGSLCGSYTIKSVSKGFNFVTYFNTSNQNILSIYYDKVSSCPDGQELNPDTQKCEEPPEPPRCTDDQIYNTETEQCEKRYCSTDEVFNLWQQEKAACDAKNGFHHWQCDDVTKSIESSCNQPNPDACVQGMPQWPDCLDNSGGDGGDGGDIGGGGGDGSTTNPGGDGDTSNPDEPDPTQPDMSGLESRLDTLKGLQDQTNQKLGDIKEQSKLIGDLTNQHLKDLVDDAKQRKIAESERSNQLMGKLGSIDNSLGNLGTALDKLGEGSKTHVGDVNCNGTFSCSGNLYECYMARQQWSQSCLLQRLTNTDSTPIDIGGEMTDINTSSTELSTKLQEYNSKYGNFQKLVDGEVNIEESLNTINEENGLSFDDKCPEPISLKILGANFVISYQPFCDLALYVRAMLMLSASIFSIVMIAKFS